MTRHEGFFEQAKSDFAVFQLLQSQGTAVVAECHVLHYLQMATEKLAKAVASRTGISVSSRRHDAFSRLVAQLANRPDVLRAIGYADPTAIRRFLSRALPVFQQIENLNPALANQKAEQAGRDWDTEPNCEYPWWRTDTSGQQDWRAPCLHSFPAFHTIGQKSGDGATMMRLVSRILDRFDSIR